MEFRISGFGLVLPIFLLFVLSMAAASPAAVRVYAKVDAETAIYPGDEITYSIVVEGGGKPSKIDISLLTPFQPRHAGSGTSMQTVNDRTTVSYSDNFVITAAKAGPMHLPGVTVVVDGQTYTTNPVEVTVSKPGTTDRMTLEFLVSEKQCYVGQPLVMTVRWIVTARTQQGAFDVPVFQSDDFYVEDLSDPANPPAREQTAIHGVPVTVTEERRLIRGMEAAVVSFRKVLIPRRSGRLTLDPLTISANLAVGRERTSDFFNPYRIRFQRVSVPSNPVELDVRPLPETGRPSEFYGLVGQYTIAASATPTKVNVGDPITLTIRIGGNPFLKPVQWPALEQVPELAAGFKIPAEKASPVLEGGSGSPTPNSALGGPCKVFTQTIRANSDTVTQVPAIPLAYFDSERGRYMVAKTEPIQLQVAPTKVLTNVDVEGTTSAPAGAKDFSPVQAIRQGLSANYYGPQVLENQRFSVLSVLTSPVHVTLWSIPLMGLIVSAVVKLAGRTSPESLARKRRRRAAGMALAQLKKVTSADSGQQHELLLSAMKGYIGDRFDKVAASLTAQDCGRAIVDATGDGATAGKYKKLIDACEAARYARVSGMGLGSPTQNSALGVPFQPMNHRQDADATQSRGQDARDVISPGQVQEAVGLIQSVEKLVSSRVTRRALLVGREGRGTSDERRSGSSKSRLLLLALCLSLCQVARAASSLPREQLHGLLQEANAAFQGANAASHPDAAQPLYEKAILLYEKLIDQGGIQNAKLYYNLANAYLLKEDLGRAIVNYRRAAQLDRSDLNIQKNLAFARSRRVDRLETSAERRVLATLFFWHYDFSLQTKLFLACLFFAVLCVALTWIVWLGRGSVTSVAAVLSAVLWVSFLASILVETRHQASARPGVITAAQVVAHQGDGPNYPPSFKDALHAGLEFELLEHRPGWWHIELSDGTDAWIPGAAAELV